MNRVGAAACVNSNIHFWITTLTADCRLILYTHTFPLSMWFHITGAGAAADACMGGDKTEHTHGLIQCPHIFVQATAHLRGSWYVDMQFSLHSVRSERSFSLRAVQYMKGSWSEPLQMINILSKETVAVMDPQLVSLTGNYFFFYVDQPLCTDNSHTTTISN